MNALRIDNTIINAVGIVKMWMNEKGTFVEYSNGVIVGVVALESGFFLQSDNFTCYGQEKDKPALQTWLDSIEEHISKAV